jgi:autotransporter passenger strand-loop-strand repeat protein
MQNVHSGGKASSVTLRGGVQDVLLGGITYGNVVSANGLQNVYGTASATSVRNHGSQVVFTGGVASNTVVSCTSAKKQSPDEAWMGGDGDAAHIREGQPRRIQGFPGDAGHRLNVGAAGDLRHHAAVEAVGLDLGGNDIGSDGSQGGGTVRAVGHFHNGGRGLVAGAFHTENVHR